MNVEFRHINYSVGDSHIIEDVSFVVEHGTTYCILGFSGSGKTTLLKLLLGLIKPDVVKDDQSHGIFVDGIDICTLQTRLLNKLRKRMAIVFQYGALFDSLSVWENVGYRLLEERRLSRSEIDDVIHQALCFVGMPETKNKMPWELSGGMKKRVAIARALASGAEMILFDEPTAGLDPVNARKITDFIAKLKSETDLTSIVVTHDLEHAFAIATRINLLDKGEIVFEGPADEFKQSKDERILSFLSPKSEDLVSCDMDFILKIARDRREGRI